MTDEAVSVIAVTSNWQDSLRVGIGETFGHNSSAVFQSRHRLRESVSICHVE